MKSQIKQIVSTVGLIGLVNSNLSYADDNQWLTGVKLYGLVQVEAQYHQDYEEIDTSDIVVDEIDLGIEAQVNKWAKADIIFIYEENDTPWGIDEAFLTLGNTDESPLYLSVGQMYVPFGNFESYMVSDSHPVELAETSEKAIKLGFETGGLYGSVYMFNGTTQNDNNNTIDHYGANIGFAQEGDGFSYDVGINYINDMGDSDALGDLLEGIDDYDYVEGFGGYLNLNFGPASLYAEYITALDEFSAEHIAFKNDGAQPATWNVEVGYTVNLGYETTFAFAYQGTEESLALEQPNTRLMGLISLALNDNTWVAFEYVFDEDYDENDGGTGKDAQSAILQLGIEF
jgi:hypothetical protein